MSVHRRVEARDRGLDRVSRLTKLTLSGGLVLSGGFAALAAHAYAGTTHAVAKGTRKTLIRQLGSSNLLPGTATTVAPLQTPSTLPQSNPGTSLQTVPPTTPPTVPQTVPDTTPQTVPQYSSPPVVSGGS